jgi:hypothetical protein
MYCVQFSILMANLTWNEPRYVRTNVVDLLVTKIPSRSLDGRHLHVNIYNK